MRPTGLKSYNKKTKRAVFECSVPGTRGHKRVRKVVTVAGWDDLLDKLKAFRDSIKYPDHAAAPVGDVPTVREYYEENRDALAITLSREKRKNNEVIVEQHLLPVLGNVRLDRITAAHAEDVIASMRKKKHDGKPYSNSYINTVLAGLRRIVTHAFRRRMIAEQPFSRERLPLLPEAVVQNELTIDERDHLLASFNNEAGFRDHFVKTRSSKRFKRNSEYVTYYYERFLWSEPLFIAAFFTGLRLTDLRLLKWSSVDLKAGVVRLVMRKTQRSVTIPITQRLRTAFETCRKRTVVAEYVFLTPEGRPYGKATIMRYFTIAKQIAGIKRRFRFHDQRHTFASILATNGINAFTLRDLLGHTSTRTTERYARPSNQALAAVQQALS